MGERLRWLSVLTVLGWLPLAYWTGFNDCFPLTKLLLLLVFGSLAFGLAARRFSGNEYAWVPLWLGVLISAALLGSVRANPWRSVPEAALLAFPLLAAAGGIRESLLARARLAAVFSALLAAGIGLWQFAGGENATAWISPFGKGVASTIGNPDLLGGFLILSFALAAAAAFEGGRRWHWKIGAAVIAAGILVTEARAAWLGAGFAALLLFRRNPVRLAAVILLIAAAGGLLAASKSARARFLEPSALKERLWTWNVSARLVRAKPLVGYGAGNFRGAYLAEQAARKPGETRYHYTEYAHLEPLHFWVETGAAGLGVLLWGLWAGFARWRSSRLKRSHPALWRGIGAGAAGTMVNAFFSFPFHVAPTAAAFWFMFCAAPAAGRRASGRASTKFGVWLIWLALFPFIVGGMRFAYHGIALRTGQIQAQAGMLREADETLAHAMRMVPKDARAYWHAGVVSRRLGDLESARSRLKKGLALEPDFAELNLELGLTLKGMGKPGEAELAYRAALRSNPNLAEAWNNLGNIFGEQGRLAKAEAAQRRALELAPQLLKARQNLAVTLMRLGRNEEALRILEGGK